MEHLTLLKTHPLIVTLVILVGAGGCAVGDAEVGESCELSYGRGEFEDPMFSASVDSDNADGSSGICMGTQLGDYCSDRCSDDDDCPGTMVCSFFCFSDQGEELNYCWAPQE